MKKTKDKNVAAAKQQALKKRSVVELAEPLKQLISPINKFIQAETSSGVVLLITAAVALLWANLNPESYLWFWGIHASLGIGHYQLDHTFGEWINDGLMTIFFLQVGLEIKREMQVGDLSSFRHAILPVTAAAGGMMIPGLFFTLCAHGTQYANGWGIPVATDIAFALGVITLLGKRVPSSLKIFLAALAIADDLGAVLVIALFYSSHLNLAAIGFAAAIFAVLMACNKSGARSLVIYAVGGFFLWLCVLNSGVHASLAGVLLAITIPTWTSIDRESMCQALEDTRKAIKDAPEESEDGTIADKSLIDSLEQMHEDTTRALPPLIIMERSITTFVQMVIMPLFALANSGVIITKLEPGFLQDTVTHGIALGLILGKPIGITLGTFLTIKLGLADFPRKANWTQLIGVGMLGGIGFTMSLFVSGLALGSGPHLNTAKLAILCSSSIAGMLGFIWLWLHPQNTDGEDGGKTGESAKAESAAAEKTAAPDV